VWCYRRCVAIYIRGVECAMVTALFVMSSVGSLTCRLELSFQAALESVGWSVLGWVMTDIYTLNFY
jgi:hypothetical protein